ncbi:hypothetical protein M068_1224 [Bacteroides fragilis str. J38-1]|nr:hypothetical protein M068_1224 [Bacteroides fragilis str. J38-1]
MDKSGQHRTNRDKVFRGRFFSLFLHRISRLKARLKEIFQSGKNDCNHDFKKA